MSKHSRLKKAREALGLTRKEVATKLNVAVSTYRHWEIGTEPNTLIMTERVCSALKINITWYITGKHMDTLTNDEKALIEWFRGLSEEKRKAALKLLEK